MSPPKTVYTPRFGSRRGSSQRDEPQPTPGRTAAAEPASRCRTHRNKRCGDVINENTRFTFKVKLQKVNSTLSQMVDKTPRGRTVEPAAKTPTTPVSSGGAGPGSDPTGGHFFFFSPERPTSTPVNKKEKVKLAVLKTISKMLEENRLIRQRLTVLSQAS